MIGRWLLVALLGLVSCGHVATDAESAAGDGGASSTAGGAAQAGSAAEAGAEESIEQARALQRLLEVTCTDWTCTQNLDFEVKRVSNGIASGRLRIDPDVLERCLASDQWPDAFVFDSRLGRDRCPGLWVPLTPLGEACDTDFACVDGFCERTDFSRSFPYFLAGGCGICRPRSKVGGPCLGRGWAGAEAECDAGLACIDDTCVVPVAQEQGASCAYPRQCREGLHCRHLEEDRPTCDRVLAAGEACRLDADCSDVCVTIPPDTAGTCGARPIGAECRNASDCAGAAYCEQGHCAASHAGTRCNGDCGAPDLVCSALPEPTCLPRVGAGNACQWDEQCPARSRCLAGRCGRLLAPGAQCAVESTDRCADGTACVNGACQRLPTIGQACAGECASGTCFGGQCIALGFGDSCDSDRFPTSHRYGVDLCGPGNECGPGPDSVCVPAPAIGERCEQSQPACDAPGFCTMDGVCAEMCVLP